MPDMISSWGKSRLKGASTMCKIILDDIEPVLKECRKVNPELPADIKKIVDIIISWQSKTDKKLDELEGEVTRSLIGTTL